MSEKMQRLFDDPYDEFGEVSYNDDWNYATLKLYREIGIVHYETYWEGKAEGCDSWFVREGDYFICAHDETSEPVPCYEGIYFYWHGGDEDTNDGHQWERIIAEHGNCPKMEDFKIPCEEFWKAMVKMIRRDVNFLTNQLVENWLDW